MIVRRKERGRNINGIFILDKPKGLSSNQALQKVKRLYCANKAGHTGSLDVPATGLLPICIGEATKISSYLLEADKYYQAKCKLGITTTTGDAAGDVIDVKQVPKISKHDLEKTLLSFIGEISQIPPMFSALKHNGKRLYKLAYQGIEVEREPRSINIYDLGLLDFSNDFFTIFVHSSKGTYIRTLVQDIGDKIGCGAHVVDLRRTALGGFKENQMMSFSRLEEVSKQGLKEMDKLLLPMEEVLCNYPQIYLSEDMAKSFCHGMEINLSNLPNKQDCLRVYNHVNKFVGIGEINLKGYVKPKRLINS